MQLSVFVVALGVVIASSARASAQGGEAGAGPAAPVSRVVRAVPRPVGFRAFVIDDVNLLAASQSFEATVGTSRLSAIGAGADLFRQGSGVFWRGAASRMSSRGGRHVAGDGAVVPACVLNGDECRPIELRVDVTVLEGGGGFRFSLSRGLVVPYVGGGLLAVRYHEASDLAQTGGNVDRWFPGITAIGGVDVRIWRWVFAGAEAQYRTVPNALGSGGLSAIFGENDLGSATIRAVVGIRK